jgi:hypothetical protein
MKRKVLLVAVLVSVAALCGCASYKHERVLADGGRETTSFRSTLMFGKAASVRTSTKDTNYNRTVSVGSIEGGTETEKLGGLAEAIARGVVSGLKP